MILFIFVFVVNAIAVMLKKIIINTNVKEISPYVFFVFFFFFHLFLLVGGYLLYIPNVFL